MPAFVPVHPPRNPDECAPWLYEAITRLNRASTSSHQAVGAIIRGDLPDSSGLPLPAPDLSAFFKLIGRSPDQIAYGSTVAGGKLTLASSSNAAKGLIYFGDSVSPYRFAVDEVQGFLGINKIVPAAGLHIVGSLAGLGGNLTPNSAITDNWGGPRGGAGGSGIGGTTDAALASNDGITSYVAVNANGSVGVNPQKNGVNGAITPGATYTVTASVSCLSSGVDITDAGTVWMVSLVDSAGNQWDSAVTFAQPAAAFAVGELSTTGQVFGNVVRTVVCSGTPISTGNTPNAVWLHSSMENAAHSHLYSLVSYVSVSQRGSDILRWDLSTGTEHSRVDLFGRMGLGTGATDLDAGLTIVLSNATDIGLRITGATGQTADLLSVRVASGASLSGFKATGAPFLVAGAATDAVLVSDSAGSGAWKQFVAWENEPVFYDDSPVYY